MSIVEAAQIVVAGMAGGVLRSMHFRQDWRGYMTNIVAGALVAYYLSPEGATVLDMLFGKFVDAAKLASKKELMAFIFGAGGVAIVGWIYDLVEVRMYRAKKGK